MNVVYRGPDPLVGPKCDLCFFGDPATKFLCKPFPLVGLDNNLAIIGVYGVAACKACREDLLVGESRLPDLETRCIEGMGAMGQAYFPKLKPFLHNLHHGILANLGPETPT